MTAFQLVQDRPRLRREFTRRIGYTNGLHDIFRFERLVNYLHRIAPASSAQLRAIIMDEEPVGGTKYTDGIVEVAGALGLIDKIGTKWILSDRGYALHAVQFLDNPAQTRSALLLNAVLHSDGNTTLNLLDLIRPANSPESLGPLLIQRLFTIISIWEHWARSNIKLNIAQDIVLQDLHDSKTRLRSAIDLERKQRMARTSRRQQSKLSPRQRTARFHDHTVLPRKGWLKDLRCISQTDRRHYEITAAGERLLTSLRQTSYYPDHVFALPPSPELMQQMGIEESFDTNSLIWRAIASFFSTSISPVHFSATELFCRLKDIYPHVKLHVFNEATVESIYQVLSAQVAIRGKYLDRPAFEKQLDSTCSQFSDHIYRLQQRYEGSGYIAMRSNPRGG